MTTSQEPRCRWCWINPSPGADALCEDCRKKEALLEEGLTECPDALQKEDFERFLWKIAVYSRRALGPKAHRRWTLSHLKQSLELAIIEALPPYYVSMVTKRRGDAAGAVVTYTLKAAIPKEVLYRTAEKLGIWNPVDEDKDKDRFSGA